MPGTRHIDTVEQYFVLRLAKRHLTGRPFGQILGRIGQLAWYST